MHASLKKSYAYRNSESLTWPVPEMNLSLVTRDAILPIVSPVPWVPNYDDHLNTQYLFPE